MGNPVINTSASAAAEIERLGLPVFFRTVIDGTSADDKTVPAYLRSECQRPHIYFEGFNDLARLVPGLTGLCPLWEHNGDAIIGRLPDGSYVRFYYEDAVLENANASITVLGKNYQQFVTSILINLSEAGLLDKYGDEVASFLGYKHMSQLQAALLAWTDESGEADLARFRDSLG
jgi:hypothetical protein